MARDLFDVPIFFIVFRETIEAAIIVSVLLSFVEQLMTTGRLSPHEGEQSDAADASSNPENQSDEHKARVRHLIKRMRIQIWAGTLTGFFVALCIGAAFIAVFYTKLTDLWAETEEIWEGIFSIIACAIIYIMGVAFLKMDRSRIKWRYKLAAAFERSSAKAMEHDRLVDDNGITAEDTRESRSSKWALFILPFVTVIREGLEAIVFVGGVSLNTTAAAIPIPVVVGLICGIIVGYIIYRTGSTATLHWFLIGSTTFLFLIGAGLMSKGIGYFQYYRFRIGVGSDVSENGDGTGSFQVAGNVWHMTYGNPETGAVTTNGGWQLFNAILGWNNTATLGSILSYVFYWLWIVATLIYLKWAEGRFTFWGRYPSKAYLRRAAQREEREANRAAELAAKRERSISDSNPSDTPVTEKAYGAAELAAKRERSISDSNTSDTPVTEKAYGAAIPTLEQ